MKIAIPVIDDSKNPEIAQQLGRAPFYMVYDTESKTSNSVANPAQDSPSGAGVEVMEAFVGSATDNINAYIDGKMSELETIHSGHHGKGAN